MGIVAQMDRARNSSGTFFSVMSSMQQYQLLRIGSALSLVQVQSIPPIWMSMPSWRRQRTVNP